ncbi:MAG TPA: hypothetical protein VGS22_02130 [Thermoanaerobaculia bacterium]|jgi:hypothetical protein|nr:hypothetical protein [Thermoanaerobaculia bacterium]
MPDNSYADKINTWQITVQNIQEVLPDIPGVDPPFSDLQQKVTELRIAHDNVQMMSGKLREAVVARRKLDADTRRSARRLAAVARGHLGFDNPILESFKVRSEGHRNRKAPKATAPPKSEVKIAA